MLELVTFKIFAIIDMTVKVILNYTRIGIQMLESCKIEFVHGEKE